MYVALPFSLMNSWATLVGKPDRVTRKAGRVGLMGSERGGGSMVFLNYYTVRPNVSVSLGV